MKRQPTPEQQQAAKERRERFSQLAKQIADMTEERRAELASKIFIATIEGHTLSMHNQLLVALQNPNATLVGGFHQWHAHGRTVRKGEHGLCIWIPKDKKKEQSSEVSQASDEHPNFFMGTVFDVSQTDPLDGQSPAITPAAVPTTA